MKDQNNTNSVNPVVSTTKEPAPFDAEFVLKVTLRNLTPAIKRVQQAVDSMYRTVDRSVEKTLSRVPEFEGNIEKSNEIFKALSDLQAIRKQLDELVIFK
jgi:hypothetical protein